MFTIKYVFSLFYCRKYMLLSFLKALLNSWEDGMHRADSVFNLNMSFGHGPKNSGKNSTLVPSLCPYYCAPWSCCIYVNAACTRHKRNTDKWFNLDKAEKKGSTQLLSFMSDFLCRFVTMPHLFELENFLVRVLWLACSSRIYYGPRWWRRRRRRHWANNSSSFVEVTGLHTRVVLGSLELL